MRSSVDRGARGARRPHKRGRDGFTLIEVMVAVAIMTVGAMGIMALQQATTRGNREARQMTVATEVTRVWLERIRRDAMLWNQNNTTALRSANGPLYLRAIQDPGEEPAGWFAPHHESDGSDVSFGFDYRGVDTETAADMRYCTYLQLTWVHPNDTIRVEARTWWRRNYNEDVGYTGCARGSEASITTELEAGSPDLRSVQAATLVRWTPLN